MSARRNIGRVVGVLLVGLLWICAVDRAAASDWLRFRGPDGAGVSADTAKLPVRWNDKESVAWKTPLPGPGSSSPIVVGNRVLVTCWDGYGVTQGDPGDQANLRRHLICVARTNGKVLWDKSVEPTLPEDPYSGMFTQHGYASHTPVSDGKNVYVFFGKTGALAFDLEGNKLWQTPLGTGSGINGWGSASSPILYKDMVIVTASAESQSIVGLDKSNGKEKWRYTSDGLKGVWGTPILVETGGRTDLVLSIPEKIIGLNPDDGTLRWQCDGLPNTNSICSSVIAHDGVVFALETGPRGGGTMAVRSGGEGDVSASHVVWRGKEQSRIGTPVFDDGRIYWVGSGRMASCVSAADGKKVYQTRLGSGGSPAKAPGGPGPGFGPGGGPGGGFGPPPGGGFGPPPGGDAKGKGKGRAGAPGGFGRGGGGFGMDYASPVLAQGNIYYMARSGEALVYTAGPECKLVAQNTLTGGGDFSATPAISDGQLFIRSSKFLYCIAQSNK